MSDPVTIGLIIAAVGVVAGAGATVHSARQQQKTARRNAKLQEFQAEDQAQLDALAAQEEAQNAALAEQEATREAETQAFRERRIREQQRFESGAIRAETAAAGLLVEGSPLYVLEENLRQSELGLLTERAASEIRQQALISEGRQRTFQSEVLTQRGTQRLRLGRFGASITRQAGRAAQTAGFLQAGGTLLSGVGGLLRSPTTPSHAGGSGEA